MSNKREDDRRRHPRFQINLPVYFNLNPDYHYVPGIRKPGVAGTVRNISLRGIRIESRMDLQDVCQVFPEAIDEATPLQLEVVFKNARGRRVLLKGSVRWYQLSEPDGEVWHFQAGLDLKDDESINIAKSIMESATQSTIN